MPKNLHLNGADGTEQISECIKVSNENAFIVARELASKEGILAGISTGANVWAALEVAKRPENSGKTISSVSKNLNYLIVGEKPTKKKIDNAKKLKINVIDQAEFMIMLNKSS